MTNLSSDLPKYAALKEYIKEQIKTEAIKYGDKMPSENELAGRFNLSRHTVRQALAQLVNEGWIFKEQGKGTFCSFRPKGDSKNTVAVLTTYISDYIFPKIISGIEEVLSSEGYNMLLANTNNDKAKEARHIENLSRQKIDGIIIEPTKSADENVNQELLNRLKLNNIKIVYLNSYYDDMDSAYVIMDDLRGGYIATKYLIDIGHRKIAGMFKMDDKQGISRYNGYLEALKNNNIEVNDDFICKYNTNNKKTYTKNYIKNLIRKDKLPTAIVCYNDEIALRIIDTLSEYNIRVPEDVSVVGYDDSSLSLASQIKLTTIKHPKKEMGRQAARFIIDMIDGKEDKPSIIYEPELVVRNSCRSINSNKV